MRYNNKFVLFLLLFLVTGVFLIYIFTTKPSPTGAMVPVTGCGNGVVESVEECDDGNTENGDGCSSICTIEEENVEEREFPAEFKKLERAKKNLIEAYINFKSKDPRLARSLANQFAEEREGVLNALRMGKPVGEAVMNVEHSHLVGLGTFSIPLEQGVTWVCPENCEITDESIITTDGDKSVLHIIMAGIGAEHVLRNPDFREKTLEFVAMEIPVSQQVTISSSSFSPICKGVVVVGVGLFVGGCQAPSPPPCKIDKLGGTCPNPAACPTGKTCKPVYRRLPGGPVGAIGCRCR